MLRRIINPGYHELRHLAKINCINNYSLQANQYLKLWKKEVNWKIIVDQPLSKEEGNVKSMMIPRKLQWMIFKSNPLN